MSDHSNRNDGSNHTTSSGKIQSGGSTSSGGGTTSSGGGHSSSGGGHSSGGGGGGSSYTAPSLPSGVSVNVGTITGNKQQTNVTVSTPTYTYTRPDGTVGTTTDYRHSDAAKAADAANRNAGVSSGGGGGGGTTTIYVQPSIPENTNLSNITINPQSNQQSYYESFNALFGDIAPKNTPYKIITNGGNPSTDNVSIAVPQSEKDKIYNDTSLTWGGKLSAMAKQSDITPVEQFVTDFIISPIATTAETFLFDSKGNFSPVTLNPVLLAGKMGNDLIMGKTFEKIDTIKTNIGNSFNDFVNAKDKRTQAENEFIESGAQYEAIYNDDGTIKYSSDEVRKQAFDDYENEIRGNAVKDTIWNVIGLDVSGIGGRLSEYEKEQGTGLERTFDSVSTALLPIGIGTGTVAAKGISIIPKSAQGFVSGFKVSKPIIPEGAKITAKIGETIGTKINAGVQGIKAGASKEAELLGISLRQTGKTALDSTNYLTTSYMLSDKSMSNEDKIMAMGSSLVFGAGLGAGTKLLSRGLIKETNSIPYKVSNFATKPLFDIPNKVVGKVQPAATKYLGNTLGTSFSKLAGKTATALSTPAAIPLTVMGANYAIDAGKRVISSDNKLGTLADIYASEIIPMSAGGIFAFKKMGDFFDYREDYSNKYIRDIARENAKIYNSNLKEGQKKTTVKKEVRKYLDEHTKPASAGDSFIATFSNKALQEDSLSLFFDKNRYTENPVHAPKGYKQTSPRTEETNRIKNDYPEWDISYHVDEDGRWLDTQNDVIVRDSESEIAGLYIASRPQLHYAHIQSEGKDIRPSFFPTFSADARPSVLQVVNKKAYVPEILSDLNLNLLSEYRAKHGKDVTRIGSEDWKIVNDSIAKERDTKPYEERTISPHIKREAERIVLPSVVLEDYGNWRTNPEFIEFKGKRIPFKTRKLSEYKYGVKDENGNYKVEIDETARDRVLKDTPEETKINSVSDLVFGESKINEVVKSVQTPKANTKTKSAPKTSSNSSYYTDTSRGLSLGNVLGAGSLKPSKTEYNYYTDVNPLTMVSESYAPKTTDKNASYKKSATADTYYAGLTKEAAYYARPNNDIYYSPKNYNGKISYAGFHYGDMIYGNRYGRNNYPAKNTPENYIYGTTANYNYDFNNEMNYRKGKLNEDRRYRRRKNKKGIIVTDVYTQFRHPFNFLGVDVAGDLTEVNWGGNKQSGYVYDELKGINKKWNKNTLIKPQNLEDIFGVRTDIKFNKPKKSKKSKKSRKH